MEQLVLFYFWITDIILGVLQFFFCQRLTNGKARFHHYAIFTLFYGLCSMAGSVFQAFLLTTLLNIFLLYWANRLLLLNKALISAVTAILAVSVSQLSYGVFNSLSSLFLPFVEAPSPAVWITGVLSSLFSLILFYCCARILPHFFSLDKDTSHEYLFMLVAPSLFLCVMGYYIINTVYGNVVEIPLPMETGKNLELLLIQVLGFLVLFSTLHAYKRLNESFCVKSRLSLLEQETHAQKTYVAEAKIRYEKTISFRHDFKNHLSVLDGLLKTGKNAQAKDYLAKLDVAAEEISLPVHTGNPVVDILVGSKLEAAAQCGIKADISLALPSACGVDDLDLCIIFSNALDNAVNACSLLSEGSPRSVRIAGEQQGDFFLLEFENDCPPKDSSQLKAGTGISNMKAVAEKYGGAITMECQGTKFYLHILLNIS